MAKAATGVLLEIDSGVRRRSGRGEGSKPWRLAPAAVRAARDETRVLLGPSSLDLAALSLVLSVRERMPSKEAAVHREATALLQAATNARPPSEVQDARRALHAAIEQAGGTVNEFDDTARSGGLKKLEVMHEVLPRLWVGGWAALNDHFSALKARRVTHVLSVVSAEQRRLPAFVKQHLYIRVDDREEASEELASHFEEISHFVDAALSAGGTVFVHCGAGISRAPTATTAYVIWKLRLPAADALGLVRRARPCVRPNIGFVQQLKAWEECCLSSQGNQIPANSNAE
ncbi:MAG: hypothetical protein SGPRY_005293 [Prymnesium sp.]